VVGDVRLTQPRASSSASTTSTVSIGRLVASAISSRSHVLLHAEDEGLKRCHVPPEAAVTLP
jgi:hypothetical protein